MYVARKRKFMPKAQKGWWGPRLGISNPERSWETKLPTSCRIYAEKMEKGG